MGPETVALPDTLEISNIADIPLKAIENVVTKEVTVENGCIAENVATSGLMHVLLETLHSLIHLRSGVNILQKER